MDSWLLENLICPSSGSPLRVCDNAFISPEGTRYPVINEVPIMIRRDVPQTIWMAQASAEMAERAMQTNDFDDWFISTVGVSDSQRELISQLRQRSDKGVDPVASVLVAATNGNLYRDLVGRLTSLPIPELRIGEGGQKRFLDIGCSWGRWSIGAARKGYNVVGIDPSLGAVLAAKRVCADLNLAENVQFVVGDARYLPFKSSSIDVVFSYSVLQHFGRGDAKQALREVGRVLKSQGESLIQMPNRMGFRNLYNQWRRGFKDGSGFDVRYWKIRELIRSFEDAIGPTEYSVDCFFGLGLQPSDARLLGFAGKSLIFGSESLRKIAEHFSPARQFADSLYLRSHRKAESREGR
jgi:SAM-dependent methyltransferase